MIELKEPKSLDFENMSRSTYIQHLDTYIYMNIFVVCLFFILPILPMVPYLYTFCKF